MFYYLMRKKAAFSEAAFLYTKEAEIYRPIFTTGFLGIFHKPQILTEFIYSK